MRRRRGARATWLPVNPTYYGESDTGVTWYQNSITINPPEGEGLSPGDTGIQAVPLTLDATPNADVSTGQTLADLVQGQDYLLQRVVGKVWFEQVSTAASGSVVQSLGCIGLAVLPTDPEEAQPSIPAEEWNPLFSRNSQQPWIWRRTWRLNPTDTWTEGGPAGRSYPSSSAWYGSVADGGHLDTKIKRRITKEHRLYLVAAAGVIEAGGQGAGNWSFGYDLRILGSMRRGKNVSSF